MEVDATAFDHIIENITYGLVEPKPCYLAEEELVPYSPSLMQQQLGTQGTQDFLSFPSIDEVDQLQASNLDFNSHLALLVKQYYRWKLLASSW